MVDFYFEPNGVDRVLVSKCCEHISKNKIAGAIIEIGTRRGGGAVMIAEALERFNSTNRLFVCVDPYGHIEYQDTDGPPQTFDYTNAMRDETIPKLHEHIGGMGFNFIFLNMEDTEFFSRFPDGIPVYSYRKQIENNYAFVFLDGPHAVEPIKLEIEYFLPKIPTGGIILFDDTNRYNHAVIDEIILNRGFKVFSSTSNGYEFKVAYIKE